MLIFSALLTLFMLVALLYDVTRYIIPNWLNLIVLLLYPAMVLMSPEPIDWLSAVYALLAVFGIGFVLFVTKLMGGGDVKLLCACAVWCGFGELLLQLLIYTSIIGGLLAIFLILARPVVPWLDNKLGGNIPIPRLLTHGQPIPYGLAIAGAFLILLLSGDLPGLPELFAASSTL